MPETSGTGWDQIKALQRHGTDAYGQSSISAGTTGTVTITALTSVPLSVAADDVFSRLTSLRALPLECLSRS